MKNQTIIRIHLLEFQNFSQCLFLRCGMKKDKMLDKKELIHKCKTDRFTMIKIKKILLSRDEIRMKKIKKLEEFKIKALDLSQVN
jgi:hypothetical protein